MARDETHFFDRNYGKGLAWWEQAYFSEYKGEKMVGEKSANYMYDPKVVQRIAASLPQVRLICCLRDPIERMYSHYIVRIRERGERVRATAFLQAATKDSDLVQRGLYFKQIKRFLEVFPQERLLITIYEDKDIDPVGFIQGIYDFLSIDSSFAPPSANLQTKAGALEYKNEVWLAASKVLFHPQSPFVHVHVLKALYSKIRPKWNILDVDEHSVTTLSQLFYADITRLEKFLRRDLRCWKSKVLTTS